MTLLGLVVLIGWALDILVLKSVLPGLVAMKANTALAFLLSGISLGLTTLHYAGRWPRRLCRLLASAVAVIGGLTLGQYLTGWDLGIDQLLFMESASAVATSSPGRMAPTTALNFLLIGLAIRFLSNRHGHLVQALAIVAGLIGLLALLGYSYGATALYGTGTYTVMSAHTSLAFVVLSLAILLARPDHLAARLLASRTSAGIVARWMLPASLVLPFVLGWLRQWGETAGYYDGPFGLAVMVALMTASLALLVGYSARSIERVELERQGARTSLQTAAEHFMNVVNTAADAIVSIDTRQRIVLFNPSAEQIFGYSADEAIGQPLHLLLPERYATTHHHHVQTFGAAPEPSRHMGKRSELTGRRKDGSEFPVEATISKVTADGQITYTAILRDISERKQAEQALQQKDKLLTMVGTMAQVGGWEFDACTLKGTWTDEVARIHEVSPNDQTGVETGLSFYVGESRKKIETAVKDAIEHGRPYDLELELVSAKGNHKWVRTIGQPVTENGAVVKVWGSLQDITERKRAEDAIRQLNIELEDRVRRRTAQLETANKELESFSYSVSHDLRAPLRGIDGFSQALVEDYADKLGEDGKNYLQRVRAASQRMAELIDDMLKLARVTRAPIHHEPVDLSAQAHSILAELQRSQPERSVEIVIESGQTATGDPKLLRVLLENLLANAWKFTGKQPHPKIEFGARRDNGSLVYFVRDNGAGFDMKYVHRLFGAFQRLHTIVEFPGTGIGLATVQRIAHRHGGRVWAEAAEGQGATFFFTLP